MELKFYQVIGCCLAFQADEGKQLVWLLVWRFRQRQFEVWVLEFIYNVFLYKIQSNNCYILKLIYGYFALFIYR